MYIHMYVCVGDFELVHLLASLAPHPVKLPLRCGNLRETRANVCINISLGRPSIINSWPYFVARRELFMSAHTAHPCPQAPSALTCRKRSKNLWVCIRQSQMLHCRGLPSCMGGYKWSRTENALMGWNASGEIWNTRVFTTSCATELCELCSATVL